MNNSYNALRNITSFRNTGKSQPISGIELMIDDKNMYFAGNDDGYVMTIDCPYGTQAMANDLLAKAKGFEYQGFTAEQESLGATVLLRGTMPPLNTMMKKTVGF